MDEDDVRIFCALAISGPPDAQSAPRPRGVRRVARGLGLDEKTVLARLRRLESGGFIKYHQAAPDLAQFGMRAELTCRFEAVNIATKLLALRAAQQLDGMVEALDFLGNGFVVTVAAATRVEATQIQAHLAHRFEMERREQGYRELEPSTAVLRPVDWRLIERLRYDARAPFEEVARALRVTPRMVRYRLRQLLQAGALTIRPMIDARRLQGLLVYRLQLTVDPPERAGALAQFRQRWRGSIWATRESLAGPILLDMFGSSLADPEDAAVAALEIPGVQACRALLLKEVLEPIEGSWIDRCIAARVTGQSAVAT